MAAPRDVLLIGGTGFMGPHVARALLAAGHRVTVLSRGRREGVEGAETLTAERRDPVSMAGALAGRRFDLTVDFLAYDDGDLDWLSRVPAKAVGRYAMISTGQVYLVGAGLASPVEAGAGAESGAESEGARPPFVEADADGPLRAAPPPGTRDHAEWGYGAGKRRAERALLGLRESRGLEALALRIPIVQGEGDGSLRLWAYLERMLDGGPLVLPDGGRRPTRFLYVGDLAQALVRIAERRADACAYNLAAPEIVTLREFLERTAAAAGVTARLVEASWADCRAAGLDEGFSPYAGAWTSILDPSRAEREWRFGGTPLDDYLPRVVCWHLEHRRARGHPGYSQRSRELELAARLGPGAG